MPITFKSKEAQAIIPIIHDFIKSRNVPELTGVLKKLNRGQTQISITEVEKSAIMVVLNDVLEMADARLYIHILNLKLRYQAVTSFQDQYDWFMEYAKYSEEVEFFKRLTSKVHSCSVDE